MTIMFRGSPRPELRRRSSDRTASSSTAPTTGLRGQTLLGIRDVCFRTLSSSCAVMKTPSLRFQIVARSGNCDRVMSLGYVREEAGTQRYNVGTDTPKLFATSCGGVPLANSFLAA